MRNRLAAASFKSPAAPQVAHDLRSIRHIAPERQQPFIAAKPRARRAAAARGAHNGSAARPGEAWESTALPSGPVSASISARATAPGRSSTARSPSKPITVDSRPNTVAPPSRIISTPFPRLSATCAAAVGLTRPEALALGAAMGRPPPPAGAAPQDDPARAPPPCPARAHQQRQRHLRPPRQDQRQGSRPESLRQPQCQRREHRDRPAPRRSRAHARSAD